MVAILRFRHLPGAGLATAGSSLIDVYATKRRHDFVGNYGSKSGMYDLSVADCLVGARDVSRCNQDDNDESQGPHESSPKVEIARCSLGLQSVCQIHVCRLCRSCRPLPVRGHGIPATFAGAPSALTASASGAGCHQWIVPPRFARLDCPRRHTREGSGPIESNVDGRIRWSTTCRTETCRSMVFPCRVFCTELRGRRT